MLNRRPTAIAAPFVGLMLAASVSACGFHYPTDRPNLISAGVNERTGTVYVLGARVLSTGDHQGRLIGALANELDSDAKLTKVSDAKGVLNAKLSPITIPAGGNVNLAAATTSPVTLTGDFAPGDVLVNVQLTFSRGGQTETVELDVPVVKDCYQYTQVPTPSPSTSSSSSSTATSGSSAASTSESTSTSSSASTSASSAPSESAQAPLCSDQETVPSESAAE